ncbi:hypothetical protein ACC746_37285, partial [Rhizobium ruizarguesonis]
MASAQKIIIDTYPGPANAAAIMLAFGSPDELAVLGITTVAGNVPLSLPRLPSLLFFSLLLLPGPHF